MEKVIIFTNMPSIKKHWQNALENSYITIVIDTFENLIVYLQKDKNKIVIMLDEMSLNNVDNALEELNLYPNAIVLLFNALPQVHHASTLLGSGIKGYENAYINKDNLLNMLEAVKKGNNWLFAELTYFIINKYIQNKSRSEPDFFSSFTQKEKEIALMIADGLSNKEIAQREKIALSTVKGHIHHIFEKAGVNDRISLALKFNK